MGRSIRVRLLLWYAAVLTAVVGGFAGLMYYEVRAARLAEVDGELAAAAAGLEATLRAYPPHLAGRDGPPDRPPPEHGKRPPRPPGGPPPDRPPPDRSFPPPDRPFPPPDRPFPPPERQPPPLDLPGGPGTVDTGKYFAVWRYDASVLKEVRLPADTPRPDASARPATWFRGTNREFAVQGPHATTILVGKPADAVAHGLTLFAWQLAGTGAVVLGVGLAGGWLISRRIFRPVAAIARSASRISATNLSERIDADQVDVELADLAHVLNRAFDRLEAAFARQARFTADASHELRTPLAVIRTQAELALSRPRGEPEYRAALETCVRAAERMGGLVERLLLLARADAGWPGLRAESVELAAVAAESAALLAPLAATRGVVLRADGGPARAAGDAGALAQVASNLLANAIQYNRPGGEVRVTTGRDGGDAVLTVADTGPGIPAADQPHLFERFYRVDKARSRASGGTGLGLAICKAVVEAHGGRIGFESVEGKGTTFTVRVPAGE